MKLIRHVEIFLKNKIDVSRPVLLGLSGGPDSLFLFYALLHIRKKHGLQFSTAHVDHQWRKESGHEANYLETIFRMLEVPFYVKVISPQLLEGNLESACRLERYKFFKELCLQHGFQAILTGHHRDDLAETVIKRLLEGSHWSEWEGIKGEGTFDGLKILRPLIGIRKTQIEAELKENEIEAFIDPTNHSEAFLRGRTRTLIFPWLREQFGKEIDENLVNASFEMSQLNGYFEKKLAHLFETVVSGPWGCYFLCPHLEPVEIHWFVRRFCKAFGAVPSRQMLHDIVEHLLNGSANKRFRTSQMDYYVDRFYFFVVRCPKPSEAFDMQLQLGTIRVGEWEIRVQDSLATNTHSSWKEAWHGVLVTTVPAETLRLKWGAGHQQQATNWQKVKETWSKQKVPAFLYEFFPTVWMGDEIVRDFLRKEKKTDQSESTEFIELTIKLIR